MELEKFILSKFIIIRLNNLIVFLDAEKNKKDNFK